jgi:hypothetical protein
MKKPINTSGPTAEQKKAAAALGIDLPADWKPTAEVSITQVAPDPDQLAQELRKDPARLTGVVRTLIRYSARLVEAAPLIQKGKKRAELEARLSEEKQREAAAKYEEIKQAAHGLMIKDPRLRRAGPYKLAKQLIEKFPHRGWSVRTIQRALSRKKK